MTITNLRRRRPDYTQFMKVLRREGRPTHLPFYEHGYSMGFFKQRTGHDFADGGLANPAFWPKYVDFWLDMGFDVVPLEVGPNMWLPPAHSTSGSVSRESEAHACIRTLDEFERYPWPEADGYIDYRHFETVADLLPDGVKIVGGVGGGPYEWATVLMGVVGLSLALFDDPELVGLVFGKLGGLYQAAHRRIASMPDIVATRQGDDLGFKTATFLKPADLRRHVFPIYKAIVNEAHQRGKPFILHSCGNLATVYDDLIDDCGIDAKHSFEEAILPVEDFKRQYGARCTPLGGLDVDLICRGTEAEIRAATRSKIEQCYADGYWALGTGNSLTDYMPVANYLTMLDEGMKVAG
ncbi:MAG: uroporphyrinogen-III decarboxylase-like protein [Armatimonadetes bacterium]|nr:uroporphyrinogen-III decarboxylase-like protein [Armatimonadota bacterium]